MDILKRSIGILGIALLIGLVLHTHYRQKSLHYFVKAHQERAVLFGDSHADDIPWPGAPRFSGPAQDLFSTLKMLETFVQTRDGDSKVETIVVTIWPHKFVPLEENRMSGTLEDDQWTAMAMGRMAGIMSWADLFRQDIPWPYRAKLALHTLQLKPTYAWTDVACKEESVAEDFSYGQGDIVRFSNWFGEAHISRRAFNNLVDLVSVQGWRLVLVENPIHPCYYELVNAEALADYNDFIQAAIDRHGNATFLQLGRENLDHTIFSDYHHLTCKGEALVEERLRSLIGEQYPH
jgi:hypothetical protein